MNSSITHRICPQHGQIANLIGVNNGTGELLCHECLDLRSEDLSQKTWIVFDENIVDFFKQWTRTLVEIVDGAGWQIARTHSLHHILDQQVENFLPNQNKK